MSFDNHTESLLSATNMVDGDGVVWKSLSLTHVVYPQGLFFFLFFFVFDIKICFISTGDLYGKCLGLSSLLPHAIIVAFFTLTLFVRDIHVVSLGLFRFVSNLFWSLFFQISFFAGQVGNEALNFVLKRIIREGRPLQIIGQPNVNTSYGWPSSHCQFQSFFFIYSTFCIVFRLLKSSTDIPKWFILGLFSANITALTLVVHSRFVSCIFVVSLFFNSYLWFLFLIFVFFLFYRTYLRYHFAHQCLHGLLIGSVIGALWFVLVNTLIEPYILVPLIKR